MKHDILCNTTGPVVDGGSGGWRIVEWSECPQDREEMRMTTFKPWEYRADAGFVKGTDLTGYTVVAVDGDLGHVEAEYDGRPAYLDVDVGSWLLGHHVTLPAGLVERIDTTERKVYVDRTKDQIEHAPRPDQAVTDHVDYWERLGSYYSDTYMPPDGQM